MCATMPVRNKAGTHKFEQAYVPVKLRPNQGEDVRIVRIPDGI